MRWLLLLLCGCGGSAGVSSVQMALGTASGLDPARVKSVEVLVLGGDSASCARALQPASPLDDPELTVLKHALFAVDGSAKHLGGVPAGQHLVFYAEAFESPDGVRPYIGRGCAEGELTAGASQGVSITLTAAGN
jgi:hypothetical protein